MHSSRLAVGGWLALLVLLVGCSEASDAGGSFWGRLTKADEGPICPSLPLRTAASFRFDPGLSGPGVFDVTLEADGETERCTITLGKPNPAVRQGGVVAMGPEDRASTCTLMTLGGTYSDGSLAALEREGESKELHLKVSEGGKVIGQSSFKPDFAPDACGQREPDQIVAIRR